MLSRLFQKPSSKLSCIELDDQKIDKQISQILHTLEGHIAGFRKHLDESTLQANEEAVLEFRKTLLPCKKNIEQLKADVQKIKSIEQQQETYLFIKDEQFLEDKQQQLDILAYLINSINTILEQRPSTEDLKSELFHKLQDQLYHSQSTIAKILADDDQLQLIYHALSEL